MGWPCKEFKFQPVQGFERLSFSKPILYLGGKAGWPILKKPSKIGLNSLLKCIKRRSLKLSELVAAEKMVGPAKGNKKTGFN